MEKISPDTDNADFLLSKSESEDRLEASPALSLGDLQYWAFLKNSSQEKIIEITTTAEQWARAMQKQLSRNIPMELIWLETFKATGNEPDSRSLGAAVGYLSRCWEHGATLRQIYDEYKGAISDTPDDSFYDHGVL